MEITIWDVTGKTETELRNYYTDLQVDKLYLIALMYQKKQKDEIKAKK